MSDDRHLWGPDADPADAPAPGGGDDEAISLGTGDVAVRNGGLVPRLVAGVVGVALLVGGLGFAVLRSSDDQTPEQAVEELFDALADEDVLGVLATLDPDERDALAGPVEDLFAELERLDVLSDAFDPSDIGGVDLSFEGLELRPETVRENLVRVHIVAGTASYSLNADELPIGAFVTDTLDQFGVEYQGFTQSEQEDLGGEDQFLVVRRGSEGWRVSIGYTAAEQARIAQGFAPPDPAQALTPVGATTPELAVRGLAEAIADLDVESMVARLSPAEMRALHDYWPLVRDDAQLPPDAAGTEVELGDLQLRVEGESDDRARVYIDGFDLAVTMDGTRLQLTYADGCLTYSGDFDENDFGFGAGGQPLCADDFGATFEESMAGFDWEGMGIEPPELEPIRTPDLHIVVHRIGDDWYVAPVGTGLQAVVESLRAIDRSHLDAMVDLGAGFFTLFAGPGAFPGMTFDETGFEAVGREIPGAPAPMDDRTGVLELYESWPRPGASDEPPAQAAWEQLTVEVMDATPDVESGACVLAGLQEEATTGQLYDLSESLSGAYPPAPSTQALFVDILLRCGG